MASCYFIVFFICSCFIYFCFISASFCHYIYNMRNKTKKRQIKKQTKKQIQIKRRKSYKKHSGAGKKGTQSAVRPVTPPPQPTPVARPVTPTTPAAIIGIDPLIVDARMISPRESREIDAKLREMEYLCRKIDGVKESIRYSRSFDAGADADNVGLFEQELVDLKNKLKNKVDDFNTAYGYTPVNVLRHLR
jgi:hypothetical protein